MALKNKKAVYAKMTEDLPEYKEPPARLEIKAKDLPEIKKWEVGKTYSLTMKVKMISKSEGGWDGERPLEGVFHVIKATNKAGDEDD